MTLLRQQIQAELDRIHEGDTFRVAIAFPCAGDGMVHSGFAVDLAAVCLRLGLEKIPLPHIRRQAVRVINRQGSLIHSSRQWMVLAALEWGATHILFVDSDQSFPPDTVHRLAAHDKLVVGANIPTREIPARPCAVGLSGNPCYTDEGSTGLEEVLVCGTGLVLINTRVFGMIDPPYFLVPYLESAQLSVGEDVYFCGQLRKAGIPVYVDHDLSKEVGHYGPFRYTHEVVGETRENEHVEGAAPIREFFNLITEASQWPKPSCA